MHNLDLTMSLINRTAVYDLGEELYNTGIFSKIRYWRIFSSRHLNFKRGRVSSDAGKLLGRIMLKDFDNDNGSCWPRGNGSMVFVDPLFAGKTALNRSDTIYCHDVAPITHAEYYDEGTRNAYDRAYRSAQSIGPNIVFNSHYTEREYLKLYPADYSRTKVVPLYFKPALSNCDQPKYFDRYVLMVGGIERRKNYLRAIEAFLESGLHRQGFRLIIVGPRGNQTREVDDLINGHKSIERLGFVSNEVLSSLYRHSVFLLFPSLIEGFGVPALEAYRLGTLALVSKGTVLEEVVGPTALSLDPYSVTDMAKMMIEVAALSDTQRTKHIESVLHHQRNYHIDLFRENWRTFMQTA